MAKLENRFGLRFLEVDLDAGTIMRETPVRDAPPSPQPGPAVGQRSQLAAGC